MQFADFRKLIESRPQPVVLLEGRREIPQEHQARMVALAAYLAREFPTAIFRSGNAEGADEAFAEGVGETDRARLQLVVSGSRTGATRSHAAAAVYSLDQVPADRSERLTSASKLASPANARLFEEGYRLNKNRQLAAKARYLLRDAMKVMGDESLGLAPATVGVFYIDPLDPMAGGTGHTIRVCRQQNIPVVTQMEWWTWLPM